MKVICKVPVPHKFIPQDKSWTNGRRYTATETGYQKRYTVKNNSGVEEVFTLEELRTYFDIIDNGD